MVTLFSSNYTFDLYPGPLATIFKAAKLSIIIRLNMICEKWQTNLPKKSLLFLMASLSVPAVLKRDLGDPQGKNIFLFPILYEEYIVSL